MARYSAQAIESAPIDQWPEILAELLGRIAHRFRRVEVRERARRYLVGLLDRVERKNGWQLAEAIGEAGRRACSACSTPPPGMPTGCATICGTYVVEHLGDDASGVLIIDETGFLKKGSKSCGVARQYTGTAGDTVNCQVGVVPGVRLAQGRGLHRPRPLSAARVDERSRAPQRGRRPDGDAVRDQDHAGQADAGAGLRRGCPGALGGGGLGLWPLARLPPLAGGARAGLRADGAEDERGAVRGAANARSKLAARLPEDAWSRGRRGMGARGSGCMTGPASRSPSVRARDAPLAAGAAEPG